MEFYLDQESAFLVEAVIWVKKCEELKLNVASVVYGKLFSIKFLLIKKV